MTYKLDVSAGRFCSFLKLIFQDELGHLATTDAVLLDLTHDRDGNFAIDAIRLEPLDQWKGHPWTSRDLSRHLWCPERHEFLQHLRNAVLPSFVGIMAGLLVCVVGFALSWMIYVCIRGCTACLSGVSKLGEVEEGKEPISDAVEDGTSSLLVASSIIPASHTKK